MSSDIYETVLAHFGGSPKQLGEKLGLSSPAVGMWKGRGIPARYAKGIEALTGVSVKVIRPDDWHLYWPELKGKRRAAKAPA